MRKDYVIIRKEYWQTLSALTYDRQTEVMYATAHDWFVNHNARRDNRLVKTLSLEEQLLSAKILGQIIRNGDKYAGKGDLLLWEADIDYVDIAGFDHDAEHLHKLRERIIRNLL